MCKCLTASLRPYEEKHLSYTDGDTYIKSIYIAQQIHTALKTFTALPNNPSPSSSLANVSLEESEQNPLGFHPLCLEV